MNRTIVRLLALALLALPTALIAGPPDDAKVTAVSLSHQGNSARLSIAVQGEVSVRDFMLSDPARLVLDLRGATLQDVAEAYDGLRRGAVRDVRVRQHEVNVVRVVLEFDRVPGYEVIRDGDGNVVVSYVDAPFSPWGSTQQLVAAPLQPQSQAIPAREYASRPTLDNVRMGSGTGNSFRTVDDDPITVTFNGASIQEVAATFARYSGRDIIVGPNVDVSVDAIITNQPWANAFNGILTTYGLSVAELPGGILRIDSPGELAKLDSIEVLHTMVKRLNYAKAGEMAASIAGLITPGRGSVVADTGLNALIITDTRTKVQSIIDFAEGLDIRTPTVSIQAKLIYVDRTDLQQLGVKYDIGTSEQFFNRLVQRIDPLTGQPYNPNSNIVNLGGNALSAISNADALISGSALDLVFTTAIGGFSISSFLSALERVEMTDVEAVPIIHTLDNQEAYILSGEETPVRVIDASSFGQVNQAPRANVQFKETGIRLRVRPSVTANREIRMEVEVERSSIAALAAADLGFYIPKQIAQTRLLVKDGETAVIGGLTQTTVTRNRSGIPLLSSLPFVGSLFSFSNNNENRKDLIVMVIPRIVDDPM